MRIFKKAFDFYLQSSMHVALSVFALVHMTQYMFHIASVSAVAYFAFFGTIVGYNFVKYDGLARTKKSNMSIELKGIALLSFISFLAVGFYFFQLRFHTQAVAVGFLILTLVYTLPFFPNRKNARNWAGIKIYIVALCWVGVTLVLPLIDAEIPIGSVFFVKCIQRFILVFVLILIFEILDLANDDPHLQTVPQQIGIRRTKILGLLLLIPFYFLEFFKPDFEFIQLAVNLILIALVALSLLFANDSRSRYYTSFWVESIPVFWLLLLLFFDRF